mmetsp:Transcript_40284/g.93352  ORF Transcript_40284/g.93352 Transcript_40284/m.93352 type:complete len:227 (-) Transcript_40284:2091-2771(-)
MVVARLIQLLHAFCVRAIFDGGIRRRWAQVVASLQFPLAALRPSRALFALGFASGLLAQPMLPPAPPFPGPGEAPRASPSSDDSILQALSSASPGTLPPSVSSFPLLLSALSLPPAPFRSPAGSSLPPSPPRTAEVLLRAFSIVLAPSAHALLSASPAPQGAGALLAPPCLCDPATRRFDPTAAPGALLFAPGPRNFAAAVVARSRLHSGRHEGSCVGPLQKARLA